MAFPLNPHKLCKGNKYYVPRADLVEVKCGHSTIPINIWQNKFGQVTPCVIYVSDFFLNLSVGCGLSETSLPVFLRIIAWFLYQPTKDPEAKVLPLPSIKSILNDAKELLRISFDWRFCFHNFVIFQTIGMNLNFKFNLNNRSVFRHVAIWCRESIDIAF